MDHPLLPSFKVKSTKIPSPIQISLHLKCVLSSLAHCFNLLKVTSYGLAQNDPIKRRLLYFREYIFQLCFPRLGSPLIGLIKSINWIT